MAISSRSLVSSLSSFWIFSGAGVGAGAEEVEEEAVEKGVKVGAGVAWVEKGVEGAKGVVGALEAERSRDCNEGVMAKESFWVRGVTITCCGQ